MNQSYSELLDRQWRHYAAGQRNRRNLLIHLLTVPLFWIGAIEFVVPLVFAGLLYALGGAVLMALALFLQAHGNALEAQPREPCRDLRECVRRTLAEQFVTFPRFVLSGGWYRNYNSAV
jgi:hypothetical protein